MQPVPSSSRILYDVACVVCQDHSSGKHYGVYACDGCAGFFKRSVRRDRSYACKARNIGKCIVDKAHRNQCRACRLAKCLEAGMNKDAVQHERGPRSSTVRRQMAMLMKDPMPIQDVGNSGPLALTVPKLNLMPPMPTFHNGGPYGIPINSFLPPLMPMFVPPLLEAICESAAKLLFVNVKWANSIPAFNALSMSDRVLLLEESWKDLFVIGASQSIQPIHLEILLNRNDRVDIKDVRVFVAALSELASVHPDTNEYACFKELVLFKTSLWGNSSPIQGTVNRRLQDLPAVAALQDRALEALCEYTSRTYPLEVNRYSLLLLKLSTIRTVSSSTIVELFFRSTIGHTPIEKIIGDMQRTATGVP